MFHLTTKWKIKESEKLDKYMNFAWKLEKLWDTNVLKSF